MDIRDKKTINVLYINGGIMDMGGISSYMINYYRHIDKNKIHIDFVVHGFEKGIYDKEILESGSYIYHVPVKSKNYIGNERTLKQIFNSKKYNIVHSHLDAGSYHILKIAKECNIPIRIAHSHNTDFLTKNWLKKIINQYYRFRISNVATHRLACSEAAGKWLFGINREYTIIKNAIEIKRYQFSSDDRRQIRKRFNITDDKIVIGHVGRFDDQKNHLFLLDVFYDLLKENKNYHLVLVGDGHLRDKIENRIKKLNIMRHVSLVGYTKQVNKFYSAFDIFALPSLFEGLGIVAVEAQVSGLPCVLSDQVPEEAILSENVKSVPLVKEQWVKSIKSVKAERYDNIQNAMKCGYDITTEAKKLEEYYVGLSKI